MRFLNRYYTIHFFIENILLAKIVAPCHLNKTMTSFIIDEYNDDHYVNKLNRIYICMYTSRLQYNMYIGFILTVESHR